MPIKELPDDLRDDPTLRDFNDLPALAKSYKETKAFVGSSIRPPGPDADAATKKDFYDKLQKHAPHLVPMPDDKDEEGQKVLWGKLGRPADAKEYDFKAPDGIELDMDSLRELAKDAGMTKAQFTKFATRTAEGRAKVNDTLKADSAALKAEWGQAYDPKLNAAASAAAKLGAPEAVIGAIKAGKMHSQQLKLWDGIAKALGTEGGALPLQNGAQAGVMTPAEADAQIVEIQNRADQAYWKNDHPEHERLVKKVIELGKLITKD
jgi:hypothetical protein